MRIISCIAAVLFAGALVSGAAAQQANYTGLVYLRQIFPGERAHTQHCTQRNAFYRIGPNGDITQPKDQDNVFIVPNGYTFTITDIHLADHNDTGTAYSANLHLYLEGTQGEVQLWYAGMVVPPNGDADYDRSLVSGIVVNGPWDLCNSESGLDADHPPVLVVTGRLQWVG